MEVSENEDNVTCYLRGGSHMHAPLIAKTFR